MQNEDKIKSEINKELLLIHVEVCEPEYVKTYRRFMRESLDETDKMRAELAIAAKIHNLRDEGYIPTNKELESTVERISGMSLENREKALEKYKEEQSEYEGKLRPLGTH